jgi:hypothetical protein
MVELITNSNAPMIWIVVSFASKKIQLIATALRGKNISVMAQTLAEICFNPL